MSIWLEAARKGKWVSDHTDALTLLTEPIIKVDIDNKKQPKRGYCQYRQSVSMAENSIPAPESDAGNVEVSSVLSVRQYEQWTGRGHRPEAIKTGVTAAFAEYEASNDPFRPEAWA